jgi:hypothetical protein
VSDQRAWRVVARCGGASAVVDARGVGAARGAIDFDVTLERQPDNRSDRVKVTMSSKFLPYKYCVAEDGTPEYGCREGWPNSLPAAGSHKRHHSLPAPLSA